MAATVSWDGLRELAAFRAEKGCAISLYLNLDPRVAPTAGDAQARVNSLLDEAARRAGANRHELTHEQRMALKVDLERIRRFFELEFDRDGAHGLAVFAASLDNFWRPLPLAVPVPDAVKVNDDFYLTPLVPLVGQGEGALVAVVSRERGDLYRLRAGRLGHAHGPTLRREAVLAQTASPGSAWSGASGPAPPGRERSVAGRWSRNPTSASSAGDGSARPTLGP